MIDEMKDLMNDDNLEPIKAKRKNTVRYIAGYRQDADGIFMPYYHCVHVDAVFVRRFPCASKAILKLEKKRTVDLLEYILNEMGTDNVITIDGEFRKGFSKHAGIEISRQSMYSYKRDLVKSKILIEREIKDYLVDPKMFFKGNSSERDSAIADTIVYGPRGIGMSYEEKTKFMKENRKLINEL